MALAAGLFWLSTLVTRRVPVTSTSMGDRTHKYMARGAGSKEELIQAWWHKPVILALGK